MDNNSNNNMSDNVLQLILGLVKGAWKREGTHDTWASAFCRSQVFNLASGKRIFQNYCILDHRQLLRLVRLLAECMPENLYSYHVFSKLGDPQWESLVFFLHHHPETHSLFLRKLECALEGIRDDDTRWLRSKSVLCQWQRLLPKIHEEMQKEKRRRGESSTICGPGFEITRL